MGKMLNEYQSCLIPVAGRFLPRVRYFLSYTQVTYPVFFLSRPISVVHHYTQRYRLLLHQYQRRGTHSTFQQKQQDREIMKKMLGQTSSVERRRKKSSSNFTFFFTPREKHPPPVSFLCIHLIQSQNLDHSLHSVRRSGREREMIRRGNNTT